MLCDGYGRLGTIITQCVSMLRPNIREKSSILDSDVLLEKRCEDEEKRRGDRKVELLDIFCAGGDNASELSGRV